jgi:hypothetical protein
MAQERGIFALVFGVVLTMAVVATWTAPLNPESNSVAPIPPRETIYRPEHSRAYSASSPRLPQDRPRGLGCCLGGRLLPAALLLR